MTSLRFDALATCALCALLGTRADVVCWGAASPICGTMSTKISVLGLNADRQGKNAIKCRAPRAGSKELGERSGSATGGRNLFGSLRAL